MAGAHDLTTLNGNFKVKYAPEIANFWPDDVKIAKKLKFMEAEKIGAKYQQPVFLSEEQGATYAGPGVPAALNSAITSTLQFAEVQSYQIMLRTAFAYNVITRSNGDAAYENSHVLAATNLRRSHLKKLEAEFIYGQMQWGTVASIAGNVLTLVTSDFAPGLWLGKENIQLDIYRANTLIKTVTIPPGVATPSIDLEARTITVDSAAGILVNDTIWPKGAFGNQVIGIHQVLATAATVFNINSNAYSIWSPTRFPIGGQYTFAKINKGLAQAMARGLDSPAIFYCHPRGFADLVTEVESARNFTLEFSPGRSSKSSNEGPSMSGLSERIERGSDNIVFHSPSGASVRIEPHSMIKEGFGYVMIDDGSWRKVGSTDVTFELPLPNGSRTEFFVQMPNNMGYEIRSYSDIGLFTGRRGPNILFTGVVNTL